MSEDVRREEGGGEEKMEAVYHTLDPDAEDLTPIEIESLCPSCEENGTTKILCIRIPSFKEVILMSFACPHCGLENNELQSGGAAQEHGVELRLAVREAADLQRQVVKSEWASVRLPEVELEIPARSQPGDVTTLEGVLRRVAAGLSQDQDRRRAANPDDADKVTAFLARLDDLLALKQTFNFIIDDPSGNSFIASPDPTQPDAHLRVVHYPRTLAHHKLLGLADDDAEEEPKAPSHSASQPSGQPSAQPSAADDDTLEEDWQREVMSFHVDCYNCGEPAVNDMKVVDIPHFKETVVMGVYCDACGYRTSEVKAASGVSAQGQRLTLRVEEAEDLKRDVLKSETCRILIPQLELEGGQGVMVGKFTTVEGLVEAMAEELRSGTGAHLLGDSAEPSAKGRMEAFLGRLDGLCRLAEPFTLVLDDPAGNSYLQSLEGTAADPRLAKEWYDRTFDQDDDLGINDMRTENYTQDDDDDDDEGSLTPKASEEDQPS